MSRQEKTIIILSLGLILLAGSLYYYLPKLVLTFSSRNSNFIGLVVSSKGELKMRFGDSINWKTLKTKDRIFSKTYLFTGSESSATYAFLDESMIHLGPNSLIYLDFANLKDARAEKEKSALGIDLVDGKMQINLKEKSPIQKIKVEDTVIDISSNKQTTIQLNYNEEKGMDISVYQGDIDIQKDNKQFNVKPGEKLGISRDNPPTKEPVDPSVMEEIRRISREDHEKMLEELRSRRSLANLFHELFEKLR